MSKDPIHIKHPGALHKEMHVAQSQPIAVSKLNAAMAHAKATGNTHLERQLQFAKNAKNFHHKANGK